MTERKPRGMGFTSWIDQQILEAEKRGMFDNLPGAGKPLNLKPDRDEDYGQAWIRDYARREGVRPEEFLPTPLRLRREIEHLAQTVADMASEQEVRDTVADLNRRIVQWRRIPVGPPIHVPLVDKDEMVARWHQAHPANQPHPPPPQADSAAPAAPARPSRRGWPRLPRFRRHAG